MQINDAIPMCNQTSGRNDDLDEVFFDFIVAMN